MGLIERVFSLLFGSGRNVVKETAEVFRENAEAGAVRSAGLQEQAVTQFGAEFARAEKGAFDRVMDGINRIPRPALAFATLGLFVAAMCDPVWFAERMQGIALVPEPLWWLLGVIVSFYFGARHQIKSQSFQREIAASMARVPEVLQNLSDLAEMRSDTPRAADPGTDSETVLASVQPGDNPALEDWKGLRRG